jgi:hypothetical protein
MYLHHGSLEYSNVFDLFISVFGTEIFRSHIPGRKEEE